MIALLRLFLMCALLLTPCVLVAQEYSISGKVVDIKGNPIEFATVLVLEEGSNEFLKGTSTDIKGFFKISDLSESKYLVRISYIGFEDYEQLVLLTGHLDLKSIVLNEGAETLEQVDIIARKPTVTRKPDRLVFNIENTALTEGSTYSVLKSTPGVIISQNEIRVRSAVSTVYINNRRVQLTSEELIQLLESSPANSIKSVEVITNPPASYDADSGVVINIIMSKNLIAGYRGNVFSGFTQGVFPRYNVGTGHYFKNDKINLNLNYNYNKQKKNRDNDQLIDFLNPQGQINESWDSDINRNTWYETHNLNLNFDYYLDSKNTISLTSTGLYMPYFKYKIDNGTTIRDVSGMLTSSFTADNLSRDNKYNIGTDLVYTHDFDNEALLTISGHFTTFDYERDQNVFSAFFDTNNSFIRDSEFNTLANQNTQIITGSADYRLPLGEDSSFSTGVKYSNVITDSDITRTDIINGQEVINTANSDAFEYDEKVFAAYADFSWSSDKWDINLGLRTEQTNIEGESISLNQTNTQDYLSWFPTASLAYNLSDDVTLFATYKRSITRPNYVDLNPFTFFLNENLVVEGNPLLQPTFIQSISLGTNFLEYFTFQTYYNKNEGEILELPLQDNSNSILAWTPVNIDRMVDFGFDFSVNFDPINRWNVNATTSFFNITQEEDFGADAVKLDRWSNYSEIQNNLTLLKDNSLTVSFNVTYANTNIYNFGLMNTVVFSDLSISKMILKNKGVLSLSIEDLFNEQDVGLTNIYLDQSNFIFSNYDNRFIKVGFRYNFGNTKLSTNERGSLTNERGRLKEKESN